MKKVIIPDAEPVENGHKETLTVDCPDCNAYMTERDKLLEMFNWLQSQVNATMHAVQAFSMNYNVQVELHRGEREKRKLD